MISWSSEDWPILRGSFIQALRPLSNLLINAVWNQWIIPCDGLGCVNILMYTVIVCINHQVQYQLYCTRHFLVSCWFSLNLSMDILYPVITKSGRFGCLDSVFYPSPPGLLILLLPLIAVDKTNFMVGSYPPKTELQSYTTPVEEAPSGMIARGTYTIKSLFTDDDKKKHLQWEWSLEIKKDWD